MEEQIKNLANQIEKLALAKQTANEKQKKLIKIMERNVAILEASVNIPNNGKEIN